jgi:Phage tail tube protein, GTA-gp10
MANEHRGEVDFKVGSQVYTLRLTVNALCELEGLLQMKAPDVIGKLLSSFETGAIEFHILRAILWAGLSQYHKMTLEQVGDVIDEAGLKHAVAGVGKLIIATFPSPDTAKGANPENPT